MDSWFQSSRISSLEIPCLSTIICCMHSFCPFCVCQTLTSTLASISCGKVAITNPTNNSNLPGLTGLMDFQNAHSNWFPSFSVKTKVKNNPRRPHIWPFQNFMLVRFFCRSWIINASSGRAIAWCVQGLTLIQKKGCFHVSTNQKQKRGWSHSGAHDRHAKWTYYH